MRPTFAALGLTALLAQGCIIYEDHYVHDDTGCYSCGDDWTNPGDPQRPGDDDDDEPMIVLDLYFTDAAGEQGETLLTTLRSNDNAFDMTKVDSVRFAYGIDVVDQMVRSDEIVLLLDIADDAQPGLVDAFVTGTDDATGLVQEPFEIVPASLLGDDDDDDSSTGDDDDDDSTGTTGDDDDDDSTGTTGDDDDDDTGTGTGTTGDDDDDDGTCQPVDTSDTGTDPCP